MTLTKFITTPFVTLPTRCRCGDEKHLVVTAQAHKLFRCGLAAKEAFPFMAAADRERLTSGLCPACWFASQNDDGDEE
jgi:hypothetical protein